MRRFRVKELAESQGITQEELTERARRNGADVSFATIQRIWQNKRAGDPRISTMVAIARALGVSVEALYEGGEKSYTEGHALSPDLVAA